MKLSSRAQTGLYFAVLFLLAFWGFFRCPFYWFVGIPCPGCGMTRALVQFCMGNWAQAASFHPLVFTLPFFGLYWLISSRFLPKERTSNTVMATVAIVLLIAVWGIRMFTHFPDKAPFEFLPNAPFWRILDLFKITS